MRQYFLILIMALFTCLVNAQSIDLVKHFGGNIGINGQSIAIASNGDILVCGAFRGFVDFNPGTGTDTVTALGTLYDSFLTRFDSSGNFLWVKTWDLNNQAGLNNVRVNSMSNGDILLVGFFSATSDFDPGPGITTASSANGTCYFLRLDANGNFIWVKTNGSGGVLPYEVALGTTDNIYVTGYFENTCDFNPGAGVNNQTSAGNADIFILKLDSGCVFSWVKKIGGLADEIPFEIAIDTNENVVITGSFKSSSVDLDPSGGGSNIVTNSGVNDAFVCKLNSTGNHIWSGKIGGINADYLTGLDIDNAGNVWLGGNFTGTCDLDPGTTIQNFISNDSTNSDIFFTKLDPAGVVQFIHQIGGTDSDFLEDILVDVNNKLYVTGTFRDTIDFDPGPGVFELSAFSIRSFISTYDFSGNLDLVRVINTNLTTLNLTSDSYNHVFMLSNFFIGTSLYTTSGFITLNSTITNGSDVLILRLSHCLSSSIASVTLNPSTLTGCTGDTITIIATPVNGGVLPEYIWYLSNSIIPGEDSSVISGIGNPLPNSNYSCSVISKDGCVDRYPSTRVAVVNNIINNVVPTHYVFPLIFPICPGQTLTLISNITHGGNNPFFQWYYNGNIIPGANDSVYITTIYNVLDSFKCVFATSAPCASPDTIISSFTIYLAQGVDTNVYITGNTLNGVYDVSNTYQWVNCNTGFSPVAGATQWFYTATISGNYALVVTNGICTDTSNCHAITIVGTQEIQNDFNGLSIKPNPSSGNIQLTFSKRIRSGQLNLFSVLGVLLYHDIINDTDNYHLNLGNLEKGTYFLRLENENGTLMKRVILE